MSIAVHATCTAQAFRPNLAKSIMTLGSRLGLDLSVPKAQTCCGLTAWDAGQIEAARDAACQIIKVFADYEMVVTPSPACLHMFHEHIPSILADHVQAGRARSLAGRTKTWETYLADTGYLAELNLQFEGRIAYFRPCREEDNYAVRQILASIKGASLLADATTQCCGYGNNMIWRHPELSRTMATAVATALRSSQPDLVLTSDVGCLLQLAPILKRAGGIPMRHIAEFMAHPEL
ncbi:MAG: (Fe-S)-binding protein [Chloroflexi bacterium]|nr:(Fe-S)-binding protein [Chloroflexota bacterium]